MFGLLLNGLGVVKLHQDGEVNDRPRRQARMPAENEFKDRLIMTTPFVTVHNCDKLTLLISF